MMLNNLLDQVGEFNPQLMRELKSRLSWRNVGITASLSFLVQGMVMIGQYSKLPVLNATKNAPHYYSNEAYCFRAINQYSSNPPFPSNCRLDAFNNVLINWPKWWGDTSLIISMVIFMGLLAGGAYLLASNFGHEQRRGTLDFIRLTPQRAGSIIGGKLLGVPILVYLGTTLAFPLQIHAVHQAQLPRVNVLSWDLLMVSMAILLYLTAILTTMWFKAQSILLAGITLGLSYPLIFLSLMWYGKHNNEHIPWYGLKLGNQVFAYLLFTGMASAGIYWLYQAIRRRYLKPTATVLSKQQSYIWSGMCHLLLMGLAVYNYNGVEKSVGFHLPFGLASGYSSSTVIVSTFSLVWLMLLVPLLLPSRQSLVEWSRQRPVRSTKGRSLLADLIGHEKSPAMLAVAINMAIAAVIWLSPMLLGLGSGRMISKILLGILMTTVLVVIYSTIAHWCLFWKVNQRHSWIAGVISGLVFLPVVFGILLSGNRENNLAFLLSPILLGGMLWLNLRLWRVLKKVGRSESFQHLATA
jgi:hypothetical protein